MRKKLRRIVVACLLATSLLTVNVCAASKDVVVKKAAGSYGTLKGTLSKGSVQISPDYYFFTPKVSVTKAPAGNFYVLYNIEIQNTKTGKVLTKTFERGEDGHKDKYETYYLDEVIGVDHKKVSFTVFGSHEVRGKKGNYVCYTKNVYNYASDK